MCDGGDDVCGSSPISSSPQNTVWVSLEGFSPPPHPPHCNPHLFLNRSWLSKLAAKNGSDALLLSWESAC